MKNETFGVDEGGFPTTKLSRDAFLNILISMTQNDELRWVKQSYGYSFFVDGEKTPELEFFNGKLIIQETRRYIQIEGLMIHDYEFSNNARFNRLLREADLQLGEKDIKVFLADYSAGISAGKKLLRIKGN
jgi:hypothetical protein